MEDKHINQLTLGEKIGRTMQLSESTDKKMDDFSSAMDKKMDKFMDICDKRFCSCESAIKSHGLFIANAKGKVSVLGIVWGTISGIGSALVIWYLTR